MANFTNLSPSTFVPFMRQPRPVYLYTNQVKVVYTLSSPLLQLTLVLHKDFSLYYKSGKLCLA